MKIWFALVVCCFNLVWAAEYQIKNPRAEYSVSHLVKTVKGVSTQLKGKMVCTDGQCEFLVAIPTKSFVSSDSNRDSNMQTILEVIKYPLITVKGKVSESDLKKEKFDLPAKVSFHGVEKEYTLKLENKNGFSGSLVILLEDHKVERPSLLTVAIDNEVPVAFSLNWVE